ncbi:hypothetical protein FACS189485_02900 [Spirochaetia bacterium]|nr:hypothetical protein FACS189485_02900 [Spirochaetia bacterium]
MNTKKFYNITSEDGMTDREKCFFANIFKLTDGARDIANCAVKKMAEDRSFGIAKPPSAILSEIVTGSPDQGSPPAVK